MTGCDTCFFFSFFFSFFFFNHCNYQLKCGKLKEFVTMTKTNTIIGILLIQNHFFPISPYADCDWCFLKRVSSEIII